MANASEAWFREEVRSAIRFLRAKHVFPYRSLSSTDKEIYDDGAKRLQDVRIWRRGQKCSKERP